MRILVIALYLSLCSILVSGEGHKNLIKSVSDDGSLVVLDDGMSFAIDWWYRSLPKKWSEGKQIFISYDFASKEYKLEDSASPDYALAQLKRRPTQPNAIKSLRNAINDPEAFSRFILDNGHCYRSVEDQELVKWEVHNPVAIFANPDGRYQVYNLTKNELVLCNFVADTTQADRPPLKINDIFSLEERLNARVLQQSEATKALVDALLIYSAGLKDKEAPIGVFLFLGPTGVGKTELAKALSREIYNDPSMILRLDMSHFTESHAISRLIGSQPGYVNHEEGGQLTNPLRDNPQRVVLLDELEKAHPQVIKVFLPVFDEAFILDTKNNRISCTETIFIMTSNLCGKEIAELYNAGYGPEFILDLIEPALMEALSPEVYNRVQPILFKPLAQETMGALVELMLEETKRKVAVEKKIQLTIDASLKSFLIEHGYHPLLGARPLKKLIQQEVLTALANSLLKNNFQEGSNILIFYDSASNSVRCVSQP